MKPVNMIVMHDPDNGVWGDCTRACVASIFELPAEEVPHFGVNGLTPQLPDGTYEWWNNLMAWLEPRGFSMITYQIDSPEEDWPAQHMQFHYIRSGLTCRDTDHDTVWFGGKMVHDPQWRDPVGILPYHWPQHILLFVKK